MQSNIENALRNAKQIDVPDSTFDRVENVLKSLKQREDITDKKPIYRKPLIVAATVVMTVLIFTTTALAATGIIDFASFFQSLFDNEAVEPFIITGDDISGNAATETDAAATLGDGAEADVTGTDITVPSNDNEIDVKLLAAFYDDTEWGGLHLQFEIHDPTGTRLSDSFILILHEEATVYTPLNMSVDPEILVSFPDNQHSPNDGVQYIDEYTVLADFFIPSRMPFTRNEAGEIVVRFDFIASNIQNTTVETGFNVGQHLDMEGSIALPGAEFVQITGVEFDSSRQMFGRSLFLDHDRLTIFYSDTTADPLTYGWGSGILRLRKPNGETRRASSGYYHYLSDSYSMIGIESCFIATDLDLNDLTLEWSGVMAEHIIPGNWEFTIDIGNVAIRAGVFEGYFEGKRTEVTINTTQVVLTLYDFGISNHDAMRFFDEEHDESTLVLHMTDGTTLNPPIGAGETLDYRGTIFFWYEVDFINPGDVASVTFRGVEIGS